MTCTTTVTWASVSDKLDNSDFVKERWDKIKQMTKVGKTDGVVISEPDSPVATMTFTTRQNAEEWKAFIEALAAKYNKSIISIEIQ